MNGNMTKNRYSGQALAIAMLILVVSSLIGLAMYSRTTKDKTLTLEERASGEALEVSDVILNNITSFTVEEIAMKLNEYYYEKEGDSFELRGEVVLYENSEDDDITLLFRRLGLLADNENFSETLDPLCPVNIPPNEYQLTIQKTPPDIGYELRPGHIWSFPTWKLIIPYNPIGAERSCDLRLKISEIGDSLAGFVLTKLYCEYDQQTDLVQSCTENKYEMTNYRFKTSSGETYSGFLDDHWIEIFPGEDTIEFSLKEDGVREIPTEIRIKALGRLGSPGIKISYELEGDCGTDVNMYLVRATANCSGVYRGKEIVVPQKGHNLLFDYVYFKGL